MVYNIINDFGEKTARNWAAIKTHPLFGRSKMILKKILIYFLLIDAAFIFLLPVLYMLLLSLFTAEDLLDPSIRWIPIHFNIKNYLDAFKLLSYPSSMVTTIMLTISAIIGQTIFCGLAGYTLARLHFPGKKIILALVLIVLVIPNQALVLPSFIFYQKLGLSDSVWPMILPELFGNGLYSAMFVFVFRQVFAGIPKDLEDAAAIDGAGLAKTFRLIVAPIAQNAYITVGLFSFVFHWNEYIRPLSYLSIKGQTKTLSLALGYFFLSDPYTNLPMANEAVKGAGIILVIAPVLIIYTLVQKYFVEGIQLTGIKG
jgi:multiple sugar transport system permease protein